MCARAPSRPARGRKSTYSMDSVSVLLVRLIECAVDLFDDVFDLVVEGIELVTQSRQPLNERLDFLDEILLGYERHGRLLS